MACGPAFLIETTVDMLQFPSGAVLVTRIPLPQWAALLSQAAAVVTDQGAITGHLAAVAREFKVPALMGTKTAFQTIQGGDLITVDANGHKIYAGRVDVLLSGSSKKINPMKGSPVYRTLGNILKWIAPLNLTDPEADNFTPEGCQTLHDIIRYAHEMSLRELFDEKREVSVSEKFSQKLISTLPMEWWVIDLEGGVRADRQGPTLKVEDILSKPLLALWEGLAAVPWKGPTPCGRPGISLHPGRIHHGPLTGVRTGFGNVSQKLCHHFRKFLSFEHPPGISFFYGGSLSRRSGG